MTPTDRLAEAFLAVVEFGTLIAGAKATPAGAVPKTGATRQPVRSLVMAAMMFLALAALSVAHAQGVQSTTAAQPAAPPYQCVRNVYIDGTNGSDSNPGTQEAPWKTIGNASNGYPNVPKAGECINVLPGTYTLTGPLPLNVGGNLNTATGYVVYRSTVPQGAHIIAAPSGFASGNGALVFVGAPFIVVDGFEIDGNKSIANGTGVDGCVGGGGPLGLAHHLVVINNKIHDFGLAGVTSCSVDHIMISHNTVYNNASINGFQGSGIGVWRPAMTNEKTYTVSSPYDVVPYLIQVTDNVAYNNAIGPAVKAGHTDGNGIIIDTTLNSDSCATCGTPYPGKILVAGNVTYGNGGGGVHIFLSENVVVANNTSYNNYLDTLNRGTFRGELSADLSQNITFINNVALAVPGAGVLANNTPMDVHGNRSFPSTGISYTSNVLDGAAPAVDADAVPSAKTNKIGVNPMLTNPPGSNFLPMPGSPTIGYGVTETYLTAPSVDAGGCPHTLASCP